MNNLNNCIGVSELNGYIKMMMDRDDFLSSITLRGEISNFKRNASGHFYFSLKDDNAAISAVMFRSAAANSVADAAKQIYHCIFISPIL